MMKKRVQLSVLIEKGLIDLNPIDVQHMRLMPWPIALELRRLFREQTARGTTRAVNRAGLVADVIEAGLRALGLLGAEYEEEIASEVARRATAIREAKQKAKREHADEVRERLRLEREAEAEQQERDRLAAEAEERIAAENAARGVATETAQQAHRAALQAQAAEGAAFLAAVGDDPAAIDALLQPSDDAVDAADAGDDADADSAAESDDDAGDDSGDLEDDEDVVGDGAEPVGAVESEHR